MNAQEVERERTIAAAWARAEDRADKAERELAKVRKLLADANRGAEVNAKANRLLAVKLAEARRPWLAFRKKEDGK